MAANAVSLSDLADAMSSPCAGRTHQSLHRRALGRSSRRPRSPRHRGDGRRWASTRRGSKMCFGAPIRQVKTTATWPGWRFSWRTAPVGAGVTVNHLCASGLEAVNQAVRAARCGDEDVFIAGGVESISAPYSMPRGPQMPKAGNVTIYDPSLGWRPQPQMQAMFPLEAMGCTAENIVDDLGHTGRSRRVCAGQSPEGDRRPEAGAFDKEVLPVVAPAGHQKTITVERDEDRVRGRPSRSWRRCGLIRSGSRSRPATVPAQRCCRSGRGRRCSARHGHDPDGAGAEHIAAGVDPVTMGRAGPRISEGPEASRSHGR